MGGNAGVIAKRSSHHTHTHTMLTRSLWTLLCTAALARAQSNCTSCFPDAAGKSVCVLAPTTQLDGKGGGVKALEPLLVGGDLTISAWASNDQVHASWGRIIDFGTRDAGPGDNILLTNEATTGFMTYQTYHGTSQRSGQGNQIVSRDHIPENKWIHVVVVQSGNTASMWWDQSDGKGLVLQASGKVSAPAAVTRQHNYIGKSNWPQDSLYGGSVHDVLMWNRSLTSSEIAQIKPLSACAAKGTPPNKCVPTAGLVTMKCAPPPTPPPPTPPPPPASASLAVDVSKRAEVIEEPLFGHDLEFTRHDIWYGLSAQLVANRKFAMPLPHAADGTAVADGAAAADGGGATAAKPATPAAFPPRWTAVGAPTLDAGYAGYLTRSIRCTLPAPRERGSDGAAAAGAGGAAGACGVQQTAQGQGFNSGMSADSAIVVQAGTAYAVRLQLKAGVAATPTATATATAPAANNAARTGRAASASPSASASAGSVAVRVTLDEGGGGPPLVDRTVQVRVSAAGTTAAWAEYAFNFTSGATSKNATLRITTTGTGRAVTAATGSSAGAGTSAGAGVGTVARDTDAEADATASASASLWIGSVSVLPAAALASDGLRPDVVAALQHIGFKGLFRYPGGCFAPFYRWSPGLLPADQRPPLPTPFTYCGAVPGGVDAYSDGYVQNDIDTDAYIRLCRKLGMTPAITLALQYGTDTEVESARDWVEYCNGDAKTTPMGALRAARGHPEPYGVKYWYLGNEIAQQARYPDFPNSTHRDGPPSPQEYADTIVKKLVPALRRVDPTVQLLPVAGSSGWNSAWFKAIDPKTPGGTDHLMVATSYHGGYDNVAGGTPSAPADFTADAKHPTATFLGAVAQQRAALDAEQAKSGTAQKTAVALSLDEWGLGPPWRVEEFNVAHGLYGASFLGGVVRSARRLGVRFTNYFEPVNEGAVQVREFDSLLTPLGEVMALYAHHQNNTRLLLPSDEKTSDDLDFTASVANAAGSQTMLLHVANRNAETAYDLELQLDGTGHSDAKAKIALLTPTEQPLTPQTMFAKTERTMPVPAGKKLQLHIPAYGVMEVIVPLAS